MVRLYEYQGKRLLREFGVPTPKGDVASSPGEARRIAEEIGGAVAVKAQAWVTGRMRAGGILFAEDPEEAEEAAGRLLGSKLKGFRVERVLVEERLSVEREFYAGVIVDDSYRVKAPTLLFSTEGGVEVEEIMAKHPERLSRVAVDILEGLDRGDVLGLLEGFDIEGELQEALADILLGLYRVFWEYGARAAEINPLAVTEEGEAVALDCRISIDDSSVILHPELEIEVARESVTPPTPLDRVAWGVEERDYRGIFYFMQLTTETEGCVGFHGIGGGGSLVGVDALLRAGLRVANFADTSGNPTASKVYRCARIILSQPGIHGYFLGGACIASQEQWYHAFGLVKAFREMLRDRPGFPVVILIAGNKEEETKRILEEGLRDLPIRLEIYGREYLDRVDYVAERMRRMVEEYRGELHG